MGYTPAFDSIYTGTLYGRWPAAAVWASLLPLLDRHGTIDMSIEAICGMTGWPRDLLTQGISQLMEPDAHSRTPGHNGVRLVQLVEGRPWGWRAINHDLYREKARKINYDLGRTASGADAERKRVSRAVPTRPDASRAVPLSDSDSDSDSESSLRSDSEIPLPAVGGCKGGGVKTRPAKRVPESFTVPAEIRAKLEVELPADFDVDGEMAKFRDHEFRVAHSDWMAAWRKWMRTARDQGRYARRREARWE